MISLLKKKKKKVLLIPCLQFRTSDVNLHYLSVPQNDCWSPPIWPL
ncbi:hypothetical protein HanIR_Chr13g0631351 [Helianthus annuus]|nr:hypothetical protein HanIR_Chr13g0631351 [Helianthus annuus]